MEREGRNGGFGQRTAHPDRACGARARRGAALALGLFAVLAGARHAAADCRDPFANPDDILDFHLRTTTATWAQFQASASSGSACDDQYPYFQAEFRCGDAEPYLTIGFRRKRDRSETKQKLPIKLDFNRVVPGQRWPAARGELGHRKLSLNSGQSDDAGRVTGTNRRNPGTLSAILTEHLAWRVMKQELPEASGVAYARLTVHFTDTNATQVQGLYVLIEDIDRTAVRARFGEDEGLLVKTTDLGCVEEVDFDDGPPNPATERFASWLYQEPEYFVGAWYARTDLAMHLDPLLRQEALRELLANAGDTVLGNRNNYYALDLRGDRRWYLPWDLDDMFRPFPQVRAPETPLFRCAGGSCANNQAGVDIRENAEIRARYLEIMCQLANGVADEAKLVRELQAVDALIRPVIAAEVPTLWSPMGRDPLDATMEGSYAAEVERMKTWIPARIQAVRGMIEAEGVACPRGCTEGATTPCEYLGTASVRTCTSGHWGVCANPDPAPTPTDGGAAGDGGAGPQDGGAADDAPFTPGPPMPPSRGGCAVGGARPPFEGGVGVAAALLVAGVRRRRRPL